jgi:hypothetical protein
MAGERPEPVRGAEVPDEAVCIGNVGCHWGRLLWMFYGTLLLYLPCFMPPAPWGRGRPRNHDAVFNGVSRNGTWYLSGNNSLISLVPDANSWRCRRRRAA